MQLVRSTVLADARSQPYRQPFKPLARVRVGVDVAIKPTIDFPGSGGSSAKTGPRPLLEEPLVISRDELLQYSSVVRNLLSSIAEDQYKYAVYESPGDLEAEFSNLIAKAKSYDGCDKGLFCPGWSPDDPEPTLESEGSPTALVQAKFARQMRQDAAGKKILAEEMRKRATRQGIKNDAEGNARVEGQIALKLATTALRDKEMEMSNRIRESTTVWGTDWQEVQSVDLDTQAIRSQYAKLTGRQPSMRLPSSLTSSSSGSFPWGWLIFGVVLIGGALAIGQLRGLAGSVTA